MLALSITVKAQTLTEKTITGTYFFTIPTDLCIYPMAFIGYNQDPYTIAFDRIDVYDENLQKIKTISVPFFSYNSSITKDVPVTVTFDMPNYTEIGEMTLGQARSYASDRLYQYREEETSDVYIFWPTTSYSHYYFRSDIFGKEYPVEYCVWYKATSLLYYATRDYKLSVTSEDFEMAQTKSSNTQSTYGYCTGFYETGEYPGDRATATVTQTFFNSDEKLEYIKPVYELVPGTLNVPYYASMHKNDEDGKVYAEISRSYSYATKGFKIVNEDGVELASVNFEESIPYYTSFDIIKLGNQNYLSFYGPSSIYGHIYSYDKATSNLKMVAKNEGMRVSPTIANRSDMITVELEGENKVNREVRVVNTAGQIVTRTTIPAGQNSVRINAAELSHGLNIVNMNGQQNSNCKIIIR